MKVESYRVTLYVGRLIEGGKELVNVVPEQIWCRNGTWIEELLQAALPQAAPDVATWRSRIGPDGEFVFGVGSSRQAFLGASAEMAARDAEIADLRAALASRDKDAERLTNGYQGSVVTGGTRDGVSCGRISLHYKDFVTADAAHEVVTAMIDAAMAKERG